MIEIHFTKLEGAQNDFIVIDNRERWFPREFMKPFTRLVCHRRKGIGADGVIFIEPNDNTDFTMLFFNPDGSDGSMCGNGGRCAALFATSKGIGKTSMTFDVLGSVYSAQIIGDTIRLFFPKPREWKLNLKLKTVDQLITTHYIHVGAPHAVIFIEDIQNPFYKNLDELDVHRIGNAVRGHPDFAPEGVNANFVAVDQENIVHLRTFEKGVEAETESCGTGTIATAIVSYLIKKIQPPIILKSHGGDILEVGFEIENQQVKNVFLEGPAQFVYSGIVLYDQKKDCITASRE